MALDKGICGKCGCKIDGFGYCPPCGREVHHEIEMEFPFKVVNYKGQEIESFKSLERAEEFIDEMRSLSIEKVE